MKQLISFIILASLVATMLSAQSTFELSGVLMTQNDEPICDVMMTVTNTVDNSVTQFSTATDGSYTIDGLEDGVEYEINLEKVDNSLNGTSTFDMVLMSKYILGSYQFSNPLDFYGADVNGSGAITVQDIVIMQLVILAIWDDFPGSNWHFFREGETAPAVTFPIMLVSDMSGYNFSGVKKGDLNGSANPCD